MSGSSLGVVGGRASRALSSLVLAAGTIALGAGVATACAVCGQGLGNDQTAFLRSTAVLSLLPLALIAGGIVWIRRRSPELTRRGEFEEREVLAPPSESGSEPPQEPRDP
ncbi:MAG: hypothetical protein HOP12_04315 [Candidatus Eisenbacteria bacterium]|uniref:Uncharacterized protein n=1 Tax=Eiseniibacteriota bacterium TaxID=2212470 RepID=A0A849SCF7_UNCEI|nr:hypothetical protein [Candidatus Eisenbacteria bacterium]